MDEIRIDYGIEALKGYFINLLSMNLDEALKLINSDNLNFVSLFLLQNEIDKFGLYDKLNLRNKIALNITEEITLSKKRSIEGDCFICSYIQNLPSTLNWMLQTGSSDDGLNKHYDKVMDIVSIFLTKTYRDRTALPIICEMIFNRNRRGLFYHDILWAFFECKEIDSLLLIANYLKSEDPKDVELSSRLFNFIPAIDIRDDLDGEDKFISLLDWFNENSSYLRYTGESFQQCFNPKPYFLDLDSKYLCKVCSSYVDNSALLTVSENELLNNFNGLDYDTKEILAKCSCKLHSQNISLWNDWLHSPINKQIQTASTILEGEI